MIGHHFKGRTHSSYGNVKMLKEAHTQTAWLNQLTPMNEASRTETPSTCLTSVAPLDFGHTSRRESFRDRCRFRRAHGTSLCRLPTSRCRKERTRISQSIWADLSTPSRRFTPPLAKGLPSHTVLAQVAKSGEGTLKDIEDRYYSPYSADAVGMPEEN